MSTTAPAYDLLLKGGHATHDPVCDYLAAEDRMRIFRHPRLPYAARGTGCTLASAIAAYLAHQGLRLAGFPRWLRSSLPLAYLGERDAARPQPPVSAKLLEHLLPARFGLAMYQVE